MTAKMKKATRIEALERTANPKNNSTPSEIETANRLLAQAGGHERKVALPELYDETKDDANTWTCEFDVVFNRPDKPRLLMHNFELSHFLNHVSEGDEITYKDVPYSKTFGNGSYYNVLRWLVANGLAIKTTGSKHKVGNILAIKRAFNMEVEKAKMPID